VFPLNAERLHGLASRVIETFFKMYSPALLRRIQYMKPTARNIVKTKSGSYKVVPKAAPKKGSVPKRQEISAPLTQTRIMQTGVPSVSSSYASGDGRMRVKHREYIGDVTGTSIFGISSYAINPGLSTTFAWLPSIARNYESYRFHKLCIEYETQKSANTDGSVMIAIAFDASDAAPTNKQQLMSFHNAVRSAAWAECKYEASSADLTKFGSSRFVRSGALSANQDIKTFDVGNLFVATQGCPIASIGELYLSYDVEFMTPQSNTYNDYNAISAKVVAGSSVSKTAIYGTGPTVTGGLGVSASSNTLTFPSAGQWLVNYFLSGANWSNGVPVQSGTVDSYTVLNGSTLKFYGSEAVYSVAVTASAAGRTLILDFSALCTSCSDSTVRVAGYAALG